MCIFGVEAAQNCTPHFSLKTMCFHECGALLVSCARISPGKKMFHFAGSRRLHRVRRVVCCSAAANLEPEWGDSGPQPNINC